ncbi:small basic family protein [Paraclostridium sp. AKS73]|nr:small basic family protein [Paraclostridium sp. AKS73]
MGDIIGVLMYYVDILVFGTRLFSNLSIIRRQIVSNLCNKKEENELFVE